MTGPGRGLAVAGLLAAGLAGACTSDAAPAPPAGLPASAPPPPGDTLVRIAPPYDVRSTAAAIDAWPVYHPGVVARSVTSFDRAGGNDDGFAGTYSDLGDDGAGGHVVFDEDGPGVLRTLWFTSAKDGDAPLDLGEVRFTFDDEPSPRLRIDSDALFAGATPPFVAPLVAANHASTGGFASWVALPFAKHLRISTERRAGFYQAHWESLPPDWDIASATAAEVDHELGARFARGPSSLPLEEVPLDFTRAGAGTVDVLRFVPAAPLDDGVLAGARLAITVDGASSPAVDVPLAWFFGSGRGLAHVGSLIWTMDAGLLESRMPVPYTSRLHVVLSGVAGKLFVHVGPPLPDAAPLEVRLSTGPVVSGQPFTYVDTEGSGKLVATVLAVDPVVPTAKRWWEGDLRDAVDGARGATIHGTGHEDDHLGGWSNEFLSRPFTLPMQGCPRTDLLDDRAAFQKNGSTTMYRLWPGIPFANAIVHTTEHGHANTVAVGYAAASFLYRSPRLRSVRTDAFDVADAAAAAAHGYVATGAAEKAVMGVFEGDPGPVTEVVAHRTAAPTTFTLRIDPDNAGVTLRRRFDRHEAPARAALVVDGVVVTTLRTVGRVAEAAPLAERDLFVPAALTRGKISLEVRWVPDPGTTSANVRFEAWPAIP